MSASVHVVDGTNTRLPFQKDSRERILIPGGAFYAGLFESKDDTGGAVPCQHQHFSEWKISRVVRASDGARLEFEPVELPKNQPARGLLLRAVGQETNTGIFMPIRGP